MSAEGLLDNPALFCGVAVDPLQLAREYLHLAARHSTKMKSVVFHVRRMLRDLLTSYQLMEECLNASNLEEVAEIVKRLGELRERGDFTPDPQKDLRAKLAMERRKVEEGKRKAFEDRMKRKAKREGKEVDFYLKQGATPPTRDDIDRLKGMECAEAFAEWKQRYSQHCFAFHFGEKGCERDRTCSFLHAEFRVYNAEEPGIYG
jgi:hypothetical protein